MNNVILIGTIIFFIYILYILIITFINKEKVVKLYKRAKKRDAQVFPFLPNKLLNYILFNDSSILAVWFTRIMAIIGLSLSSFIIYAYLFYKK